MTNLPYFDADEVRTLLPYDRAVLALESALQNDVDPEEDGPRLFSPAPNGEFLLMPAQGGAFSGVKALTIAPENPARGLEKIQGLYVLYSSDTLAPAAVLEGASLTAIRTPAVALLAVSRIAAAVKTPEQQLPESPRILVFGAGVQAIGHVAAAHALYPSARFEIIGRSPERVAQLIAQFPELDIVDRGSGHAADRDAAVSEADVILCTTTSTTPLFDGSLVRDNAIVAAVGTHGLDARELDDALVARSDIVVEGRKSARTENGNLSTALSDADWENTPPANLKDLVAGRFVRTPGRPACYTGVGMSWEDLICAAAVFTEGRSA
ncbi:ornithine cyclodeaminase family protein [Leucobacter coleopterorum]|uniref:Ornithine cyclodeaminase family protein n=1 Tax=Leucobacter coleopterorum TaxID=2714933 RepID=A0ABX6JZH8_9MICO|nr:ornithine cyclodeaminase family protein [Leucobacter coleopterorum]QIM18195.1 ornithine cyclodeaminase family protein [Leucobacter coleopterorum]